MATILDRLRLAGFLLFSGAVAGQCIERPIRIPLSASLVSLDPTGVQDANSLLVSRQLHCQLVRMKGRDAVPEAAETIQFLGPTRIRMRLRQDLAFSDGRRVGSKDVVATFQLLKDSRLVLRNIFQWIESIDAVDSRTVDFRLTKPIPAFLKFLGAPNYAILPADFVLKARADPAAWANPPGCGKYRLTRPADTQSLELLPLGHGRPLVFHIGLPPGSSSEVLGQFDVIDAVYSDGAGALAGFREEAVFDPRQFFIGINSTLPRWKGRDERCRLLGRLETSRLIEGYGPRAERPQSYFPRGVLGFSSGWKLPDPGGAVRPSTVPFTLAFLELSVPEPKRGLYLDVFKPIVGTPRIALIKNPAHFGEDFLKSGADALVIGLKSNYLDGYEFLMMFSEPTADFTGTDDKGLGRRVNESQLINDPTQRSAAYQTIAADIAKQCLIVPAVSLPTRRVLVRASLETPGFGEVPLNEYDFSQAR